MRGSWRPNRNCNILTPLLWPSALCLSCSLDAQPEAQRPILLGDGFLYCILSASSLDPNSLGDPSPFGLVWLSLPHLVYNSVLSLTGTHSLLSWLSYIIVQHPLNRRFDLWNGMIDRHPAEITVIQFTGHCLPVHQSMSVPWEFFFYLVPFHQPISAHAISSHNCHQNVSPPSGVSPWNGIFGRVKGQNTTIEKQITRGWIEQPLSFYVLSWQ